MQVVETGLRRGQRNRWGVGGKDGLEVGRRGVVVVGPGQVERKLQ